MIPKFKQVTARLSQESMEEVYKHLDGIEKHLHFLIELTAKERHRLPKMSRKSADFVQRCLRHAVERPHFLPAYFTVADFQNDKDLSDKLRMLDIRVSALHKNLKSTIMMVEAELYQKSRLYYGTASAAAREGSADAELIVNNLAFEFKPKPSTTDEEDTEVTLTKK